VEKNDESDFTSLTDVNTTLVESFLTTPGSDEDDDALDSEDAVTL
jgi:hypothetical protein